MMDDIKFILLVGRLISLLGGLLFISLMLGATAVYLYKFYDPRDFGIAQEQANRSKSTPEITSEPEILDGIHVETGFIVDQGYELVIANCTGCHSSKLVTQNRATEEGWKSMIEWMQATQNLWDLGANEEKIIAYLAKNYAPEALGRRKPLTGIEWYELE